VEKGYKEVAKGGQSLKILVAWREVAGNLKPTRPQVGELHGRMGVEKRKGEKVELRWCKTFAPRCGKGMGVEGNLRES